MPDLSELRQGINEIDKQIEQLFKERMELCVHVAEFKKQNKLQIFQSSREDEILERVKNDMPDWLGGGSQVLFSTLMDISKLLQYQRVFSERDEMSFKPLDLTKPAKAAVPGISGAYAHIACEQFSGNLTPVFCSSFRKVFKAVENGECEFGVLPIENSTAGSVVQTFELLKEYDLRICATTKLTISHCLAVRPGMKEEDIESVYSHEQALMQCSRYLHDGRYKTMRSASTSLAAEYVAKTDEPCAAICSEKCAAEQGLTVIKRDIADARHNYTRFILVSKETLCPEGADIISVSLALPHQKASLYRLLTKFSAAGLNLTMISSRPIADTDFDAVFYLDFEGSICSPQVVKLIDELRYELSYFKFLGNYSEIKPKGGKK